MDPPLSCGGIYGSTSTFDSRGSPSSTPSTCLVAYAVFTHVRSSKGVTGNLWGMGALPERATHFLFKERPREHPSTEVIGFLRRGRLALEPSNTCYGCYWGLSEASRCRVPSLGNCKGAYSGGCREMVKLLVWSGPAVRPYCSLDY